MNDPKTQETLGTKHRRRRSKAKKHNTDHYETRDEHMCPNKTPFYF
jgi:hypothetical protein